DGLEDAAELAAGTDPLDPDTDGDGLADGIDPRPAVWDDPDGDAGGDGLGYLFEVTHGLDPAADNALDSDGDGWPDWKELMAGTATNDMSSVPVNTDGPQLTQVPVLFEATVTLNADLPCPAVLNVGGHTLVLHKAGSWTLTLKEGVAYGLTLTAPRPCAVSLSCSLSSAFAAFQDPGGVFTGGAPVPGGAPAACGMIAQPVVSVTPEPPGRVCFHADAPKTVAAKISPPMEGSCQWYWYGGDISSATGRSANISWDGGDSSVSLRFTAAGASQPRVACREVTKCSRPDGEPDWCDGHGCEHWFCACDNAGASGGDWCGFHGRPVSECREDICPTHDCPYAECPEDWCHEHGCWYAECSALWCHMCGHILPACVCGPVDEGVGGGGGGGTNGTNRVYGRGEDVTAAVNNDDDDADFTLDDSDGEVAGDDDLIELWPVGPVLGQCCPCPEHRAASVMSASLVNGTGNLALYEDAAKTTGFGGTVREGQPVYAEGTGASPYPWADRLLWRWVDANNDVHYLTNRFTVLSVRLFGDIDLDGDVDEDDIALHPAPSEDYGWG
ncbi:MAG: hypothetical protein GX609_13120, partial [Actinomycetales bacterium]|nr:hypothetical protein [Actinomycetales bacterium]